MGKVVTTEKVMVVGDFNGHVDGDMGGFGEVDRSFEIGQINDGGIVGLGSWQRAVLDNYLFPEKEKLAFNI